MTGLGWIELVVGLVVTLATFFDLFQSVVLPRPSINRFIFVRVLFFGTWSIWRWIGRRFRNAARRETWLAAFGPAAVIGMFLTWALAFLLGYALILDGLRTQIRPQLTSFGEALYLSATTIVPLSYGDFVPEGGIARLAIILESATGIGVAALVITLLFSLYESFQDREELVVTLDAIAGAPPSGVHLLETVAERGLHDELVKTFSDWRQWSAAVLESHLAYPVLFYFRSSHDNEAWLNSFGAVMDAAALVISTVDEDVEGPARLMFTVGYHLVEDMAWSFGYHGSEDPLVDREEFDQAAARLEAAGYEVRPADAAWEHFALVRAKYAWTLKRAGERLGITPAAWVGDSSYVPHADGRGRSRRRKSVSPPPREAVPPQARRE